MSLKTYSGLMLGVGGVALLVDEGIELGHAPWFTSAALRVSPFFWALGSIVSKRRPIACAPFANAVEQAVVAATFLTMISLLRGSARWTWEARSLWAPAYLAVFGSCIAFGSFFWRVHQVTPAQLGTYAHVNPAVAVLFGGWPLDETLGTMQIAGTIVILGSVVIVSWTSSRSEIRAVLTK